MHLCTSHEKSWLIRQEVVTLCSHGTLSNAKCSARAARAQCPSAHSARCVCLCVCAWGLHVGIILKFYASRRLVEHRRSQRQCTRKYFSIYWHLSILKTHIYIYIMCVCACARCACACHVYSIYIYIYANIYLYSHTYIEFCGEWHFRAKFHFCWWRKWSAEVSASFGGRGHVPHRDLGGHFQHPGGPVDPVVPGTLW